MNWYRNRLGIRACTVRVRGLRRGDARIHLTSESFRNDRELEENRRPGEKCGTLEKTKCAQARARAYTVFLHVRCEYF